MQHSRENNSRCSVIERFKITLQKDRYLEEPHAFGSRNKEESGDSSTGCAKMRHCARDAKKTLSMLENYGLIRSQIIEPSLVGVHPSNRDGLGVVPHACHQLMEDIVSVG